MFANLALLRKKVDDKITRASLQDYLRCIDAHVIVERLNARISYFSLILKNSLISGRAGKNNFQEQLALIMAM